MEEFNMETYQAMTLNEKLLEYLARRYTTDQVANHFFRLKRYFSDSEQFDTSLSNRDEWRIIINAWNRRDWELCSHKITEWIFIIMDHSIPKELSDFSQWVDVYCRLMVATSSS